MLRVFSSIRKSLIKGNTTVKYLKYAVGEFLLIVVGILAALQIQTWNEGRKDRIEERKLLIRIVEELSSEMALISTRFDNSKNIHR